MFIIKIYTIFPNNFPLFDDELKTNKKSADKRSVRNKQLIIRFTRCDSESKHHRKLSFIDMYAFYIVQIDINKMKINTVKIQRCGPQVFSSSHPQSCLMRLHNHGRLLLGFTSLHLQHHHCIDSFHEPLMCLYHPNFMLLHNGFDVF